jgi:hypothetical protein
VVVFDGVVAEKVVDGAAAVSADPLTEPAHPVISNAVVSSSTARTERLMRRA